MGYIAPRGFQKTHSLCHSDASVLTITLPDLPNAITLPMPTWLCGSLNERSVQTTTSSSTIVLKIPLYLCTLLMPV